MALPPKDGRAGRSQGRCPEREFGPKLIVRCPKRIRAASILATQYVDLQGILTGATLRHSFVSLLLAEGANVVEVARQAGHSPTMTLSTYAHLFEELDGADRISAEKRIRHARRTQFVPENEPTLPT